MAKRVIFGIKAISKLLEEVKNEEQILNIVVDNKQYKGRVLRVNDFSVELFTNMEKTEDVSSVEVNWQVEGGDIYHFVSDIVEAKKNVITLMIPTNVEIWKERTSPRLYTYGSMFCSLFLIYDINKLKSKMEVYPAINYIKLKNILNQIYVFPSQVEKALEEIFFEEFPGSQLKFNIPVSELNFLERIAYSLRQPLWVDSHSLSSKPLESIEDIKNIVKDSQNRLYAKLEDYLVYLYLQQNLKLKDIEFERHRIIEFLKLTNIDKVFVVPLIFLEDFVGVWIVKLNFIDSFDKVFFKIKALVDVYLEAIAKYRLMNLREEINYYIPIIDLSGGGIKAEINQYLAKYINVKDKVKLCFSIRNHEIVTKGEVLRISYSHRYERLEMAVKFLEIQKADEDLINSFIKLRL